MPACHLWISSCSWQRESTAAALGVDSGTDDVHRVGLHEFIGQHSMLALSQYGTYFIKRDVIVEFGWFQVSLKKSCFATVLTNLDLFSTITTRFNYCMFRVLEVSWRHVNRIRWYYSYYYYCFLVLSHCYRSIEATHEHVPLVSFLRHYHSLMKVSLAPVSDVINPSFRWSSSLSHSFNCAECCQFQ